MGDWFTLHTIIAFLLGVALSQMVKRQTAGLRAKVAA